MQVDGYKEFEIDDAEAFAADSTTYETSNSSKAFVSDCRSCLAEATKAVETSWRASGSPLPV